MKKDWKVKNLSDICEVFVDGNWIESKDQSPNGIRLVQTGNIGFGYFKNKIDKARYVSEDTFKRLKCTEIFPNDILTSRLPEPVGKSCLIPNINSKMITGVDCTIIRTKKNVLPFYLLYFQMSNQYLNEVKSMVTGTTRSRISRKNLGLINVPIAPIKEQKRIVEKLDTCMEQIDKAIQNVNQNIQNVEELFQSQLNEIFNRNNESYSIEILDNLCNKTSNIKWAEHIDDEFKYVDLSSVDRVNLKIENFNYVNHKNAPSRAKKIVKTNDVIFATTRPTLKRVTRINEDFNNQLCSTGYCVLRPREDLILTDIIYYFIQTDFFMNEMEKIQKGASYPAVSDKEVKNVEISFPKDIEKQVSISFQLNSLNEKIFDLKNSYLSEIIALNELKESILAKAFNGEL